MGKKIILRRAHDALVENVPHRDFTVRVASKKRAARQVIFFLLALGAAAIMRFVVILYVAPGTDVFYYDRQAVEVLLTGQSPYGHHFTGIPTGLDTPGAGGFAYPPLTALYLVPFYFSGDIRVGFIVADVLIAVILYLLSGKRNVTALIYLFIPFSVVFSTVYLNNALVSLLFIMGFVFLEKLGHRLLGAISFGVALSAIQFAWLLLPFVLYYYLRDWRWKESVLAVLVALVVILPFFLADPTAFYRDTIDFQFTRQTLNLITKTGPLAYDINLSLNGFLITFLNLTFPPTVRFLLTAALLPIFVLGVEKKLERFLIQATGYLLLAVFILPNDFFWAYTELPLLLFLAYLSLLLRRKGQPLSLPSSPTGGSLALSPTPGKRQGFPTN